jgi:hypothetical protein
MSSILTAPPTGNEVPTIGFGHENVMAGQQPAHRGYAYPDPLPTEHCLLPANDPADHLPCLPMPRCPTRSPSEEIVPSLSPSTQKSKYIFTLT